MEKTTKILLIVCVILLAVLSLTIGLLIGKQPDTPLVSNTTNNTTSTQTAVNNTTIKTQSDENKVISPSQAIAIANKYAKSFGEKATGIPDYYNGIGDYNMADGDPYYHVELTWIKPHNYGNSDDTPRAWYVEIDAKTGAINPRN